jgi:hypothetical protein
MPLKSGLPSDVRAMALPDWAWTLVVVKTNPAKMPVASSAAQTVRIFMT